MELLEERIKALTPQLQQEVIDFIDFLLMKNSLSLKSTPGKAKTKSVGGSLEKYKNNKLQFKEKNAWAEAAAQKHANS